jgi:hypothetical protein
VRHRKAPSVTGTVPFALRFFASGFGPTTGCAMICSTAGSCRSGGSIFANSWGGSSEGPATRRIAQGPSESPSDRVPASHD